MDTYIRVYMDIRRPVDVRYHDIMCLTYTTHADTVIVCAPILDEGENVLYSPGLIMLPDGSVRLKIVTGRDGNPVP